MRQIPVGRGQQIASIDGRAQGEVYFHQKSKYSPPGIGNIVSEAFQGITKKVGWKRALEVFKRFKKYGIE